MVTCLTLIIVIWHGAMGRADYASPSIGFNRNFDDPTRFGDRKMDEKNI